MSTKRLIGKEPSIQNIPIRTEQGKKIRDAFTCGHTYCEADYSGLELRFAAELVDHEHFYCKRCDTKFSVERGKEGVCPTCERTDRARSMEG